MCSSDLANNPIKIIDLKSGGSTSWSIALDALAASGTDAFGSLTAGNSYRFTVILQMRTNTSMLNSSNAFGAYLTSDISGATPNYLTSLGYGRFYDNSNSENKYQITFVMIGVITVPAGGPLNFNAYFKDVNGFTKTASACALSGKAMFEQVSSVS